MITEESVREVIDSARIEDVVGDFVNLRRRGNNYSGLCPFHNEKTPSFNVNPARNIYKCFGCGEGGDAVKFLMELEQLSFPDAVRWIANKYNIKLEEKEVSQEVREELQERDSLIITNDFARQYYADQLYNTDEGKSVALSYFKSRGFLKETMETFGLGYASNERNGLLKAATAAGHKKEQLEKLGLVRNGRDFFFDRVMFTIHNVSGKPIAFAGRILKKDVKAPKYVNSPETEIYHKSDVLYGMYQARQSVRKLDNVYMVEGYTDVISLHQNGIKNVVATSGTSLTSGQAKLVKRFTENVTLLYDGDKAGIKAALRGVDVLLVAGLNVRVVILPDGEDPDSYMQSVGTTAFQEYLENTRKDFLFFKADLLLEEAGEDVAARTTAIRGIGETLALVEDPLKRASYLQQFSGRLGIDESLLVNLVNKSIADLRAKARKDREREERARARTEAAGSRVQGKKQSGNEVQRTSSDDEWAGLVEPGWAGEPADDIPPPEFHGGNHAPAPPPHEESAGPDAFAFGHEVQERHLATLLMSYGDKPYDEATGTSIGQYLTTSVADVLGDFDHEKYRHVVNIATDYARRHGSGPATEWYLKHPENDVRELALACLTAPPPISPNWKEKHSVHLRQKPPEENYKLVAEGFLYNFRMMKLQRKQDEVLREIKKWEREKDDKKVLIYTKVKMEIDGMLRDLAKNPGTVVLSR